MIWGVTVNNGSVKHNLESNHNFDFQDSKMLVYIHNALQKTAESSIISNYNTIKQSLGFFKASSYLVRLVLINLKIPYLKHFSFTVKMNR